MMRVVFVLFVIVALLLVAEAQFDKKKKPLKQSKMKGKDSLEKPALLLLDGSTFPKIMPHANYSTVLMVYVREDQGDYGITSIKEDYWAFAEQSEFAGNADFVRFAHMPVDAKPDRDSHGAYTQQFVMDMDPSFFHNWNPRIYLFAPGSLVPDMYPQYRSVNVVALARWLSQKTKFYMGVPGTIQAFYWLARKFIIDAKEAGAVNTGGDITAPLDTAVVKQFRTDVLVEAEDMVLTMESEVSDESMRELARYYVKTMEKVIETGEEYVAAEIRRLEDLVSGADIKLSAEKRQSLQKRVNVLHNFVVLPPKLIKDDPPAPVPEKPKAATASPTSSARDDSENIIEL